MGGGGRRRLLCLRAFSPWLRRVGGSQKLIKSRAQVKHPFPGAPSELVAARLGEHAGVIVLPGTFFSPPFADVNEDRYLRFCEFDTGTCVMVSVADLTSISQAIANVSSETLEKVPARLTKLNEIWESLPAPTSGASVGKFSATE